MADEIIVTRTTGREADELAAARAALQAWGHQRRQACRLLILLVPRRRGLGIRQAGGREAHHWHRAPHHLVLGWDLDALGDQRGAVEALARVARRLMASEGEGLAAWEHLPLGGTWVQRPATLLGDPHAAPWAAPASLPAEGLQVIGWWERGAAGAPSLGQAGVYCVCPAGHRVALGWRRESLELEPGEGLAIPCPGC
ncbi:MAG: hypothetical protein VKQ33_09830 [Candidatus Sericytochromatia bacterium]|nr:hypothetical protein [Candidatus Sericytochromatia bacterium]